MTFKHSILTAFKWILNELISVTEQGERERGKETETQNGIKEVILCVRDISK